MALVDLSRPDALAALALAPLLWWLSRPPRPRRIVDTAHLPQWRAALAQLRRKEVRFRKARFWLLLAAFVCVVLAASGPRTEPVEGPRLLAVLLDTSPSMGAREPDGGTAFALAQDRLAAALREAPSDVEVHVLTADADGAPRVLRGAPEHLARLVASLAPRAHGRGLDLGAVAASLAGPEVAIWTLTDGRGPVTVPERGEVDVLGAAKLANRAITRVRVEDGWPLPEVRIELEVRAFPGGVPFPPIELEGGVEAPPPVVRPLGDGHWRVEFETRRQEGGPVRIALGPDAGDAQAADDAVVLAVAAPPEPVLGVLRAVPSDGPDWVGRTAATLAELGGGRVEDVGPGAEVGVLLVDGGRLDRPSARSWTFGTAFGPAAERLDPTVTGWDRRHPLTDGLDLSELVVRRALGPGALPDGTPLCSGLAGPLAVAVDRDGARSVHFAFRLEDSNLPLLAAFPQLLRRSFAWMHGEPLAAREDPRLDAAEADLRRTVSAPERPRPAFGRDGAGLSVPLLLLALGLLALRVYAR